MKKPDANQIRLRRRRRGRGTSLWKILTGRWGKQHRLPAHVTGESDWEVEVPQIRMSRAFAVMLLLHIVAVGGLFAFRIWGKDESDKKNAGASGSAAAESSAALDVATPPEIPAPVETSDSGDGPRTYIWRAGDSVQLVAGRFGITVSALREANPDKALVPGTELTVPRAGRVIGGAATGTTETQPSAMIDPAAVATTPAESRPPKAEVVPELSPGSEIPDVIPAARDEHGAAIARKVTNAGVLTNVPAGKIDTSAVAKAKPAIATTAAAPSHPAGQRVHVVAKGDTVFNLAKRYGLTAEEIAKANGLGTGFHIKLGQQIKIPVKH